MAFEPVGFFSLSLSPSILRCNFFQNWAKQRLVWKAFFFPLASLFSCVFLWSRQRARATSKRNVIFGKVGNGIHVIKTETQLKTDEQVQSLQPKRVKHAGEENFNFLHIVYSWVEFSMAFCSQLILVGNEFEERKLLFIIKESSMQLQSTALHFRVRWHPVCSVFLCVLLKFKHRSISYKSMFNLTANSQIYKFKNS